MSIKIGIYDFFAYTVPGTLYLFVGIYALISFGYLTLDYQLLKDFSAIAVVIAAGMAYFLGIILDPIALRCYRLFKRHDLSKYMLEEYKKVNPQLQINYDKDGWAHLLAYLKKEKPGIAADIEKFNVTCVMLRNVSLGIILLSITQICLSLWVNHDTIQFVIGVILICVAIIPVTQAVKFRKWFYLAVYQATTAQAMNIDDMVLIKNPTNNLDKENSKTAGQQPS